VSDPAAAWLVSLIRHGETAIELRQAGHTWNEIAVELRVGDRDCAQRAAALYLASDYESRNRASQEDAGVAVQADTTDMSPSP